MSSLRNAAPRRPHRERSQPSARSKWGLLEKHKDYSLRAADYNLKKQKISVLSRKAKEKHPDEFAYGMLSDGGKTQGRHGQGGTQNRLSHDAVKLLKTQDQGYLRVVMARTRKEIGRVKEQLAGVEGNNVGDPDRNDEAHTVVEDEILDEEAQSAAEAKSAKALDKSTAAARLRAERKKRKRLQEARAAKLELLKRRQKEIMAAADQLELQRAKMAKTVGGINKNGVKFKIRERKK
ncbi:hypothetical protein DV735_g1383, partial [Chaetothyriales sp. CBS 134920]